MSCGFTSVMYDCSTKSFEENIAECKDMVRIAKMFGASVEGEIGHVGANASGHDEGGKVLDSIYTTPEEAKTFADASGVDALAVAIGSAHGVYTVKPVLDINRLKEIRANTDVPLVLHGGSGLSDDDFRNCVANGIAKINIFTDINLAASRAAEKVYTDKSLGFSKVIPDIREAVKEATRHKLQLFGSSGKA